MSSAAAAARTPSPRSKSKSYTYVASKSSPALGLQQASQYMHLLRSNAPSPHNISLLLSILCHFKVIPLTQLALIMNSSPTLIFRQLIPYLKSCMGSDVISVSHVDAEKVKYQIRERLSMRTPGSGRYASQQPSDWLPLQSEKIYLEAAARNSQFYDCCSSTNGQYGIPRRTFRAGDASSVRRSFHLAPSSDSASRTHHSDYMSGAEVRLLDMESALEWARFKRIPIHSSYNWREKFNLDPSLYRMNGVHEYFQNIKTERVWEKHILKEKRAHKEEKAKNEANTAAKSKPSAGDDADAMEDEKKPETEVSKPQGDKPVKTTSTSSVPTHEPNSARMRLLKSFYDNRLLHYAIHHIIDLAPSPIHCHQRPTLSEPAPFVPDVPPMSLQMDSLTFRLTNNVINYFYNLIEAKDDSLLPFLYHEGDKDTPLLRRNEEEDFEVNVHIDFLLSAPKLSTILHRCLQQLNWASQWWYVHGKSLQDTSAEFIKKPFHLRSSEEKLKYNQLLHLPGRDESKTMARTAHPEIPAKMLCSIIPHTASFLRKFIFFEGRTMNEYRRVCDHILRNRCEEYREKNGINEPCPHLHYRLLIFPHTKHLDEVCNFRSYCRYAHICKSAHICVDEQSDPQLVKRFNKRVPFISHQTTEMRDHSRNLAMHKYHSYKVRAQWLRCDIRFLDLSILGKFDVIMADPPWDISVDYLSYGTLADTEIEKLKVDELQDEGFFFMWVTTRAIEFGYKLLRTWGYTALDQHIVWLKTSCEYQPFIEGTTGHYLNHSKEHLLIGRKGNPKVNGYLDVDTIVSTIRESSRKPDEIYTMIERLWPHSKKLELFGRSHNRTVGWFTLGNQLTTNKIVDPELQQRIEKYQAEGGKGLLKADDYKKEREA